MTKLTAKKKSKQTLAIVVMAVALVALLVFGGTYAWFTASTQERKAELTTGYIKLTSEGVTAKFTTDDVMPGDTVLTSGATFAIDATDLTSDGVYVAFKITVEGDAAEYVTIADTAFSGWGSLGSGCYVYGTATTPSLVKASTVTINSADLKFDATDNWTEGQTKSDNEIMNATITIKIQGYAIQGKNIEASAALSQLKTTLGLSA